MKYYIFYTLLAWMPVNTLCSAQPLDSATISRIVERSNKSVINALQPAVKPATQDSTVTKAANTPSTAATAGSKVVQDVITFLPVAFFSVLISMIFFKLRKDGVKLSDILIDKEAVAEKKKAAAATAAKTLETKADIIKNNSQAFTSPDQVTAATATLDQPANTTADTEADSQKTQSTSRLIVFICGITSIALACCICTFYFYKSFTGTEKVDLGNLTNVLYGLGLGVLPYGFNKIAAALK
ncbi:hypothetical protein [Fluviicola chungangensis]|uniref:DUF4134 domain-containing protein n=1 Tax=Fluviicola chungangensis TaxID=2597671 RepID=A0A556N7A2_9FLAO|nr:hypothetical protein [Fluviicola chungangensis]TSJ48056.1 hypothetical protein FO442_02680 [Fluviicola chungangensis]